MPRIASSTPPRESPAAPPAAKPAPPPESQRTVERVAPEVPNQRTETRMESPTAPRTEAKESFISAELTLEGVGGA